MSRVYYINPNIANPSETSKFCGVNHRRLNIESPYILRRPVQQNSRRKRHVKAMPCLCRLRRLFGSCCPGVPGSLKFYSL